MSYALKPDEDERRVIALIALLWFAALVLMVTGMFMFCGCAATKPTQVQIVAPIPVTHEKCSLPALPEQPVIVGYPSPEARDIYVSKSDLVRLFVYDAAVEAWAEAVTRCMTAHDEVLP